jgi:predicted nucleic acid-binding protein
MLDTNAISHMIHNADGVVAQRLQSLKDRSDVDMICTSVLVQSELLLGLTKRPSARLQAAYAHLMQGLTVIRSGAALCQYSLGAGEIWHTYRRKRHTDSRPRSGIGLHSSHRQRSRVSARADFKS